MRALHPLTLAAFLLGGSVGYAGNVRTSTVTVHVHRKGFLFGHDVEYTMVAPIASSEFDLDRPNVDIVVHAKDVSVADASVSEPVRHEIEDTMRGPRVLNSTAFPEIHFTAAQVTPTAPDQYRVTGMLQLHGVAQQLALDFDGTTAHYHGRVTLHASDFGIPPLTFAGGLVHMKDDIDIEFDLFGGETAPPAPPPPPSTDDHNPQ